MKEKAFSLAKIWSNDPYIDEKDQNEINSLLANPEENESEIIDRFYQDLEFGTGGLRSIIGIGSNRMNKYNIRKATQAMCNEVLNQKTVKPSACISFDNRRFSNEFAKEVARVFAGNGFKVYLFNELTPTPMLSYAVRYYKASCGVMLTASHNPKQYNGFKAYWDDGGQVTPPYDEQIIQSYNHIKNWEDIKLANFETAMGEKQIEWVSKDCNENFYNLIEEKTINREMCQENGEKVHFIYTPLHGCGHLPCKEISHRLGFKKFELVESQAVFDSEFSTLQTTPNPEDPEALSLAVALMKENNADIAYGTDPDCDRLGVVVNHKGIEKYLNGNQIAILMIHYLFSQLKEKGKLPKNPLVIKSIVTSPLQETIVNAFGGTVLNTLTGFKWMAKKWKDLEDNNTEYNYVFASEESFGYMPFDHVRDKDAVAAIALMNEITLYYKLQNKTLLDGLDDIYDQFGYAKESLIAKNFEGITGREKINLIMKHFRDGNVTELNGQEIIEVQDFSTQIKTNLKTGQNSKIDMTKSNVLGFLLADQNQLYLRPSGTEPKIKFYTMVQVQEGKLKKKKDMAQLKIEAIEKDINNIIRTLTE